jgi:hypothetical protein
MAFMDIFCEKEYHKETPTPPMPEMYDKLIKCNSGPTTE